MKKDAKRDAPKPVYGPGLEVDARPAFLFATEQGMRAVTLDRSGGNLPGDHGYPWVFVEEIMLGVHEAMPEPIDPEPVLRGIAGRGYYVWEAGNERPYGTSQ